MASLFLALNVLPATAGDVTYVGGGRYTCSGGGCGEFNAAQASRNSVSEAMDDLRTEDKIRRMREMSQINTERLSEGKTPIDPADYSDRRMKELDEYYRTYGQRFAARNKAREECMRHILEPNVTYAKCQEIEVEPKYYVPASDTSAGVKTREQIIEESDKRHEADVAEQHARRISREECMRQPNTTYLTCDNLEPKNVSALGAKADDEIPYYPAPGEVVRTNAMGDYERAEHIRLACAAAGRIGVSGYKWKGTGGTLKKLRNSIDASSREFAADGFNSDNAQDAYMLPWSKCMDRLSK